ncbi:MAG TPA: dephospho-CoA kinase [Actinomycetota bacterium]|nr:dephospho-CoA kinase [Actinomycetota bacterium]
MLLVGLTGGIASGKSTVAAMLLERGAQLIDADEIAREIVEPGLPAWGKIVEHFGEQVLQADRRLDREVLAEIVFGDPAKRRLLNEITHPRIMDEMAQRIAALAGTDAIVVCDIPLLTETGRSSMFQIVVVVEAPEEVRVERLMRTRGYTREQALERIRAQASSDDRRAVADVVIENDGDLDSLQAQVETLWSRLQSAG